MVFALLLTFECGKQARRHDAGGDSNSCPVTQIIGHRKNR
jgi:hypothetical protein